MADESDKPSTNDRPPSTDLPQAGNLGSAAGSDQTANPAQTTDNLPSLQLKPIGSDPDGMREISEQETIPIRSYRKDAYGDVAVYQPRSAAEFNQIQQKRGEIDNRRIAVIVGSMIVILVTIASLFTFLGLTNSTATSAHEDAVRLLILIVGAVLGAIFGAEISKARK